VRWVYALLLAACSAPSSPTPCAPSQTITGGGTVAVNGTSYGVSTAQVEDFLNGGSLTVTAAEADAGMGDLMAGDPVVAVQMKPSPDDPGTYSLASLGFQAAYCTLGSHLTADASGKLTGCVDTKGIKSNYTTAMVQGSVVVDSGTKKSLDATGDVELHVGFGAGAQTCQ
jgi:hypothetical protein